MAQLLEVTPILPRATTSNISLKALAQYDAALNMALYQTLIKIAFRLNAALQKDGSEPMTGPIVLAPYVVSALPTAADYEGGMIYVTDETGGPVPAFSDGTNWRRVQDRNVVS